MMYILCKISFIAIMMGLVSCNTGIGNLVVHEVKSGYTIVPMDVLGNYYRVENQSKLVKYNEEGLLENDYSHQDFSGIHSVDVTHPHKITLFYKEQQKMILLENTLNPLAMLSLEKLEERYVDLFCVSEDGMFWLFDRNKQQLLKVDQDLEVQIESFPLYQENIHSFDPWVMDANARMLVLGDRTGKLLLFDHLGNYMRQMELEPFKSLHVTRTSIVLYRESSINMYDAELFEETHISNFPVNKYRFVSFDPKQYSIRCFPGTLNEAFDLFEL